MLLFLLGTEREDSRWWWAYEGYWLCRVRDQAGTHWCSLHVRGGNV